MSYNDMKRDYDTSDLVVTKIEEAFYKATNEITFTKLSLQSNDKATGNQVIDSINCQSKLVVSVLSRVTNIEQTIGNKQRLEEINTELKQHNVRLQSSNDKKDEIQY